MTYANSAVGTGHRHCPYAIQGTIWYRNDCKPVGRERAVRFRSHGHYPGIRKADMPVGAIAIWFVRRVSTTAKHHAGIVARRTSGIE